MGGNFELTDRLDHSCTSTSTPPPRRWRTRFTLRVPTCYPSARPTERTSTRFWTQRRALLLVCAIFVKNSAYSCVRP